MLRWVVPFLFAASPGLAATLTCTEQGAVLSATDAAQLDVALDGKIYRFLNPTLEKAPPGAGQADAVCAGRLGLVAIVLPAPKPGPDEAGRSTDRLMLQVRAFADGVQDPFAPQSAAEDPLAELEVIEIEPSVSAAAEEAAEAEGDGAIEEAAEPAGLAAAEASGAAAPLSAAGCQASPGAPTGFGALALVALLALRGRRGRKGGAA